MKKRGFITFWLDKELEKMLNTGIGDDVDKMEDCECFKPVQRNTCLWSGVLDILISMCSVGLHRYKITRVGKLYSYIKLLGNKCKAVR